MKKLFLFLFLLISLTAMGQNTVACAGCGGRGGMQTMAGFMPCFMCGGKGQVVDPSYANQQAYNYGVGLRFLSDGEVALANQNYDLAYEKFKKACFEYKNKDAYFYLGAMVELSMGFTKANPSLAKEFYEVGAKLGSSDATEALNRINNSGYWDATDEMRNRFCTILKNRQRANAILYGGGGLSGGSSSGSSSSGRSCRGCNGTGVCSMCRGKGAYGYSTGTYTGKDTYGSSTCQGCNGSGKCKVCHGRGSL